MYPGRGRGGSFVLAQPQTMLMSSKGRRLVAAPGAVPGGDVGRLAVGDGVDVRQADGKLHVQVVVCAVPGPGPLLLRGRRLMLGFTQIEIDA